MSKTEDFDRGFDELVMGMLDGITGGKVDRLRETARRTVKTAQEIRPFAAAALRRVADQLDPRSKSGSVTVNEQARSGRGSRARRV
jgi:hypothetical protein